MKPETLKFAAGLCVVLAAAVIMMPALLGYALRLANLIGIVLAAVIISVAVAAGMQFIKKKQNSNPDKQSQSSSVEET